jgi:hypothetical protein
VFRWQDKSTAQQDVLVSMSNMFQTAIASQALHPSRCAMNQACSLLLNLERIQNPGQKESPGRFPGFQVDC